MELCEELKLEQSRISHSLQRLKDIGFLVNTPNGKERIYQMKPETKEMFDMIDKHVDTYCKHHCKCSGKAKEERWKR